jgi:hypothetical protein
MRTTTRALTIAALASVANAAWDTNENYCAAMATLMKCNMAYTTEGTCNAGGCTWSSDSETCDTPDATMDVLEDLNTQMNANGYPSTCGTKSDAIGCATLAPACTYGSQMTGCGPSETAAIPAMSVAGVPAAALSSAKQETKRYDCASSQNIEAWCNALPECQWVALTGSQASFSYCGASDEYQVAAVYEACGTSDDLTTAAAAKGFTPQQAAAKVGPAGTTGSFALALSALAGAAALVA